MTIKKILTVPNPFLRKEAVPVKNITNEIKQLLDDMLETRLILLIWVKNQI